MVLLTVTPAIKVAISALIESGKGAENGSGEDFTTKLEGWKAAETGSPIDHSDLIQVSQQLVATARMNGRAELAREWRLDTLLKGAMVYQKPLPPKSEPVRPPRPSLLIDNPNERIQTPEYKALMKRLRAEEEQRQYERMINPPAARDILSQRTATTTYEFNPATSIGQAVGADEVDEVTYADVNRQMALIINVLVSIIACSVAIWVAARRWTVPQRLGLSMSGSGLVAVAEVVIYMGYIRRIKDAKDKERKQVEKQEIVESWVLDGKKNSGKSTVHDGVRYRKGKHR